MAFEYYIQKGSKKLRMGFTTGSCATLAAKAAARMLLTGLPVDTVEIVTPKGLSVEVPVQETVLGDGFVSCAVQKDAGDDPDVTDGTLVFAKVSKTDVPGIKIDGGEGVGRVTRPGLDQPIGAAAINHVPRQMIASEVQAVCDCFHYEGGMSVMISLPDGLRLSKRTFNPKLGIVGGLSVLGTSGIVEPQSTQALIDCIGLELRALAALGRDSVVLTPGNYGEAFLETQPFLKNAPTVKFSNFIGDALDFASVSGFKHILLVGHIGKFVKLAGGIMNTHSSNADCRVELIAAHAALVGSTQETILKLMNAVSTDACIEILDEYGIRDEVLSSLLGKIQEHLERRVVDGVKIGAVLFSNVHGVLGQTVWATELIDIMKKLSEEK
jgi:cobalt-precorrin-5B (C1)-methyltransferase